MLMNVAYGSNSALKQCCMRSAFCLNPDVRLRSAPYQHLTFSRFHPCRVLRTTFTAHSISIVPACSVATFYFRVSATVTKVTGAETRMFKGRYFD